MTIGVVWASELIRHPMVVPTSLTHRKSAPPRAANDDPDPFASLNEAFDRAREADHPSTLAPTEWAARFMPALRNAAFVGIVRSIIERSHKAFWGDKDPTSALVFDANTRPPPGDPMAEAIVRAHRKLVADPSGAGWYALTLFCLARMAAVNAKTGYDSDQWTDLTLLWFDLDTKMFDGHGAAVATLIVRLDRDIMKGNLFQLIGDRSRHGLAEAAINATDAQLFT